MYVIETTENHAFQYHFKYIVTYYLPTTICIIIAILHDSPEVDPWSLGLTTNIYTYIRIYFTI